MEFNNQKYQERLEDVFSGIYLTTISIIQGVALGLLMLKTFNYILPQNDIIQPLNNIQPFNVWWQFLPQSLLSLMALILMTYEYMWFLTIFRPRPNAIDVVIPFVLGPAEISIMILLGKPQAWWLAYAIFDIVALFAYQNTRHMCRQLLHGKHPIQEDLLSSTSHSMYIVTAGMIISVIAFFFWPSFSIGCRILFWLILLGLGVRMIVQDEKMRTKIHKHYGSEDLSGGYSTENS